jgi:anti-anti-sigma factor
MVEVDFKLPGVAIVALSGEHDLASRQFLSEALAAACVRSNVLVDFCECTFIDSSVVHALLVAGEKLGQGDGRLELVIPPEAESLQRVAQFTSLAATLPIHETRGAGIASFRTGQHSIQV